MNNDDFSYGNFEFSIYLPDGTWVVTVTAASHREALDEFLATKNERPFGTGRSYLQDGDLAIVARKGGHTQGTIKAFRVEQQSAPLTAKPL